MKLPMLTPIGRTFTLDNFEAFWPKRSEDVHGNPLGFRSTQETADTLLQAFLVHWRAPSLQVVEIHLAQPQAKLCPIPFLSWTDLTQVGDGRRTTCPNIVLVNSHWAIKDNKPRTLANVHVIEVVFA